MSAQRNDRQEARSSRAPIRIHPRGVGELLDLGSDVLLARFGALVGVSFLVWLAVLLLDQQLGLLSPADPMAVEDASAMLARTLLDVATTSVVTAIISAVATYVTLRYLLGDLAARVPLTRAIPAVMGVTLLTLVLFMAIAGAAAAVMFSGVLMPLGFVLGGFIFVLWYKLLYAPCIVVAESPNPLRAFARSWSLTRASFGRCVGVYLGSVLLALPLAASATEVRGPDTLEFVRAWAPTLPLPVAEMGVLILAALLHALPTAFTGVVLACLYSDALVRREAVDLVGRLGALEARVDLSPPPPPPLVEELV